MQHQQHQHSTTRNSLGIVNSLRLERSFRRVVAGTGTGAPKSSVLTKTCSQFDILISDQLRISTKDKMHEHELAKREEDHPIDRHCTAALQMTL